MADINRTDSQYFGLDTTLIPDETLKTNQGAGIGVGAKLKALNVADPANNIPAYVVDAYDIDWNGYKIGDTPITSTGQLLQSIQSMGSSIAEDPWETYVEETED